MIQRLSFRLGLAALLSGALVLGGNTAQARPGQGGDGGYYAPYYGGYGGGLGYASGYYSPDVAAPAVGVVPDVGAPSVGTPDIGPGPEERPPADNAAHLQLVVPDGAEVYFDGSKT